MAAQKEFLRSDQTDKLRVTDLDKREFRVFFLGLFCLFVLT